MSTFVTIATQLLPEWYEEWLDPDLEEELENSYPDLVDVDYDDWAEKHTIVHNGQTATINVEAILETIYQRTVNGENVELRDN